MIISKYDFYLNQYPFNTLLTFSTFDIYNLTSGFYYGRFTTNISKPTLVGNNYTITGNFVGSLPPGTTVNCSLLILGFTPPPNNFLPTSTPSPTPTNTPSPTH